LELFDLTKKLVNLDSVTGREEKIAELLANLLGDMDLRVRKQPLGNGRFNLFAGRSNPELVLSTHMDTVAPFFPATEDKDFIYGRGACDAKGILAAQMIAVERLLEEGIEGVGLLFVAGEEGGSDGALKANKIPNRSRYLICGEPTENKMALATKGAVRFMIETRGIAAHSAYPEQGESAVLKLLDLLSDIHRLDLPRHEQLGETTINIGAVSGGDQANVIPDQARALCMARCVAPAGSLIQKLKSTVGNRGKLKILFQADPVFLQPVEGFDSAVMNFCTDIPYLSSWGKPFLLGPGSILDAHTPGEKIEKKALSRAVTLYTNLARVLISG
jgi:acetylornithine deacetylase